MVLHRSTGRSISTETIKEHKKENKPGIFTIPGLLYVVGKELKKVRRLAPSLSKPLREIKVTHFLQNILQNLYFFDRKMQNLYFFRQKQRFQKLGNKI